MVTTSACGPKPTLFKPMHAAVQHADGSGLHLGGSRKRGTGPRHPKFSNSSFLRGEVRAQLRHVALQAVDCSKVKGLAYIEARQIGLVSQRQF